MDYIKSKRCAVDIKRQTFEITSYETALAYYKKQKAEVEIRRLPTATRFAYAVNKYPPR